MGLTISKKSFLFTIMAIALSIVLLVSHRVYLGYKLKDELKPVETRVLTIDNLAKNMENDLSKEISIVGYRSLLSLEDYMMANDNFLVNLGTNLNTAFKETFTFGTINSQKMKIMDDNTLMNWTMRMRSDANKSGIDLDFTVYNVTIRQSSAWTVNISLNLSINISDPQDAANWTINKVFTNQINITGFVDPLYLVNNHGKVNNSINKTYVSDFSTQLLPHLLNSYYIEHNDAPSYLMRFDNNLGSSTYGIESLVNSQDIIDAGLVPKDRSAVDFIYFGSGSTINCNINGFSSYSWFKLDSSHLLFYQATCL